MGTVAVLVLVLLGIVMAVNIARGTLGAWLKAKVLNQPAPASGSKP